MILDIVAWTSRNRKPDHYLCSLNRNLILLIVADKPLALDMLIQMNFHSWGILLVLVMNDEWGAVADGTDKKGSVEQVRSTSDCDIVLPYIWYGANPNHYPTAYCKITGIWGDVISRRTFCSIAFEHTWHLPAMISRHKTSYPVTFRGRVYTGALSKIWIH